MKNHVYRQKDIVHVSFEIGLLLKGIHGLAEIIGGVFMLFLTPGRLNFLAHFLTKHELLEDPRDRVANFLLSLSNNFSVSAQHFTVFYLCLMGL